MTFTKVIVALACLMSGTLAAQEAKVTELLSKDLTNVPGKEGLMITVEYPPGTMTGETAIKRNTSQNEFRMRLWLGAARAQGWLHIGLSQRDRLGEWEVQC